MARLRHKDKWLDYEQAMVQGLSVCKAVISCGITRNAKVVHRPVNIAAGQRVINDVYHIQNVNAYGSGLRQWMAKFHGAATRYLASYLGWHRMIDRLGQNVTPTLCFLMSLGKTNNFNS